MSEGTKGAESQKEKKKLSGETKGAEKQNERRNKRSGETKVAQK